MTESAFPFGDQPSDPEAATVEETTPAERNRRMLFLVGGAAGLLVLVAAAYFLFLKGGSADDDAAPFVPRRTTTATQAKAPAAKPALPKTFNDVVGRDPFVPLLREKAPPAEPTADTADSGDGTTPVSTPVEGSNEVVLLSVHKENGKLHAKTRVGDKVYDPVVGGSFGTTFKLMSVDGKSATFVQGDEQFSLSVGQTILR